MTVRELRIEIKKAYQEQKGELFFTERALLSALFEKNGIPREALFSPDFSVCESVAQKVLQDAFSLLDGEPLQYYLGTEYFCGEEFLVSPGVLIPRPETELLCRLGEERAEKNSLVFDFCCGSGCVGITLLNKRPDLTCAFFDLSEDALKLTKQNVKKFHLEERALVNRVDVTSPQALSLLKSKKPSLVLANPPYLTAREMKEIPKNVSREPAMALFGGEDGLLFYRAFFRFCRETRIPFACEMGSEQKEGVEKLAKEEGIRTEFFRDDCGLWRAFFAQGDSF